MIPPMPRSVPGTDKHKCRLYFGDRANPSNIFFAEKGLANRNVGLEFGKKVRAKDLRVKLTEECSFG